MRTLLLILFRLLTPHIFSQTITGFVQRVVDGDTFILLTEDNEKMRIRLYGVDCPEKGQPYFEEATKYVRDLIDNKTVTIELKGKDQYKRPLGIIWIDSVNVNEELLKSGLTWQWIHNKYKHYQNLEQAARKLKINIWSKPNPIPPWEHRAKGKEENKQNKKKKSRK